MEFGTSEHPCWREFSSCRRVAFFVSARVFGESDLLVRDRLL
jgi:hypothetical protein